MSKLPNVFGVNVGRIISERGITQNELSKLSDDFSRATVCKALKGFGEDGHSVRLSTALAISKALDVDFPALFLRLDNNQLSNLDQFDEEDYLEIFRQNVLRYLRKYRRYYKSLSVEGGIQESTVSDLLKGISKDPRLSTLVSISQSLDVEIEKLFRRGG